MSMHNAVQDKPSKAAVPRKRSRNTSSTQNNENLASEPARPSKTANLKSSFDKPTKPLKAYTSTTAVLDPNPKLPLKISTASKLRQSLPRISKSASITKQNINSLLKKLSPKIFLKASNLPKPSKTEAKVKAKPTTSTKIVAKPGNTSSSQIPSPQILAGSTIPALTCPTSNDPVVLISNVRPFKSNSRASFAPQSDNTDTINDVTNSFHGDVIPICIARTETNIPSKDNPEPDQDPNHSLNISKRYSIDSIDTVLSQNDIKFSKVSAIIHAQDSIAISKPSSAHIDISISDSMASINTAISNEYPDTDSTTTLKKVHTDLGIDLEPDVDIDAEDKFDEMMVSEYVKDIILYLKNIESNTCPDSNYMIRQAEITWQMRRNLINWVAHIHHNLLMLPETLFLAINLMDRFLEKRFVSANKLQLVGIVALYIASKYEEITTPGLSDYLDFLQLGDIANQFHSAEKFMLRVLDYDLSYPGPLVFLRRISKADNYNLINRTIAKYILEATLVDSRFLAFPPSILAASALYLARKICGFNEWDSVFIICSGGYTHHSLQSCTNHIISFLTTKINISTYIFKKYNTKSNCFASTTAHNWAINFISCNPQFSTSSPAQP